MRHKRDTFSICPICDKRFKQDGIGRNRTYCSDACRQKAHRQATAKPSKRKELYTVRLDYLESQIALYEATGNYGAVDAMRALARRIGAPIDAGNVADRRAMFGQELARRQAGTADISFRDDSPPNMSRNGMSATTSGNGEA